MPMSKHPERKWDSNLRSILQGPIQISHLGTEISLESEGKKRAHGGRAMKWCDIGAWEGRAFRNNEVQIPSGTDEALKGLGPGWKRRGVGS